MRLSLATAACAVSVALLAGCSSSPSGTSSVPGAPSQSNATHHGGMVPYHLQPMPQQLSREEVAKLRPNVLLPDVAKKNAHKKIDLSRIRRDGTKPVTSFIMDDGGAIWGLHKKKIVTYASDCSGAEGGRVDHSGRLVVACTNTSTVNIYNAGNTSGPADVVLNDTPNFYPADAFEDNAGNIYATNLYGFSCTTYYCYESPGNIVKWTGGTGSPSTITDSNMYEVYFGDIDASGNCYIDGFNNSFYPQVDKLAGCASGTGTNTGISVQFPGGVYVVSPNGPTSELSVIDQGAYGSGADYLYLYTLPGLSLLATLHPPQNIFNTCDPVAGGYNAAENQVTIGDAGCHAGYFMGVPTGPTKHFANVNFLDPIDGAYVTSDK